MTAALQTYFQAEKKAGMLFMAVGIAACWVAGMLFMKAAAPFYVGMALPLLLVGIIQIAVGTTLTRRKDQQLDDLEKLLAADPAEFRQEELPRLAKVMRNFVVIRRVELGMVALGILLFVWQQEWLFSKGLGLGLVVQGATMLLADYFAEKRARVYQTFVAAIAPIAAP